MLAVTPPVPRARWRRCARRCKASAEPPARTCSEAMSSLDPGDAAGCQRKRVRAPSQSDSDEVTVLLSPAEAAAAKRREERAARVKAFAASAPVAASENVPVDSLRRSTRARDAASEKALAQTGTSQPRAGIDPGPRQTSNCARRSCAFDDPPPGWREGRGGRWFGGRAEDTLMKPDLDPATATQPKWKRQQLALERASAEQAAVEQAAALKAAQKAEVAAKARLAPAAAAATAVAKDLDQGVTLAKGVSGWRTVGGTVLLQEGVAQQPSAARSSPLPAEGSDEEAWDALEQAAGPAVRASGDKACTGQRHPEEALPRSPGSGRAAAGAAFAAVRDAVQINHLEKELQQIEVHQNVQDEVRRPGCRVHVRGLQTEEYLKDQPGILEQLIQETGRWRVKLDSGQSKDLQPENLSMGDLQPGSEVRLHGLTTASRLNGECGVLEAFIQEGGRWRVKLESGESKDVRPENLGQNKLQQYVLRARQRQTQEGLLSASGRAENQRSGHFDAHPGDLCGPGGRFVIQEKLGEGVFSTVFRCGDNEVHGMEYAIKFTHVGAMMRKATEREVKLMGMLSKHAAKHDPEGARCLLSLAFYEGFEHQGHLAVAIELMKCNLASALAKYSNGRGFPLLPTVRSFGKQILLALRVLRRAGLIHCDLKPENLLLSMDKESIKLCDFGSAMSLKEYVSTAYLQPRFYRAPEVMLGHQYSIEIDMWGAGATLFQLATGSILFQGATNNQMLHEILKVCGPFSKTFATSGKFASKHFNADGDFLSAHAGIMRHTANPHTIPMAKLVGPARPLSRLLQEALPEPPRGVPSERHEGLVLHFAELVTSCLAPDPTARSTPEIALAHRFFQKGA